MRIILTVLIAFALDLALHSVLTPEYSLYVSSIIALGISVSMLTSPRKNDRDFGVFVLGYTLCDIMNHFEINTVGKEKVIEQFATHWIDTAPNVWLAIGFLAIVTYGMKDRFNPEK